MSNSEVIVAIFDNVGVVWVEWVGGGVLAESKYEWIRYIKYIHKTRDYRSQEENYVISAFLIFNNQEKRKNERDVIKIKRDSIFMTFLRSLLTHFPLTSIKIGLGEARA